jgi:DNA-binding transcriptional LysR family regulator
MNIERFRHFLAVIEEGGFARAARRLGIQQPPLSQSIRRLERDLGVTLLRRAPRGVELTAAGRALLPEARAAVAATDRAIAVGRSSAMRGRSPVRVGVVSVAIWEQVPALLAAGREVEADLVLEHTRTNEQVDALTHGNLDLGFVAPPFEAPSRMRVRTLANEKVLFAVPVRWLNDKQEPSLAMRVARNLILFKREGGPALYDAVVSMLTTRGRAPTVVQHSPTMLVTLALVGAGVGASIVPAQVARHVSVRNVAFVPIELPRASPRWPLALAYMPLSARSDAARLLAAWERRVGK